MDPESRGVLDLMERIEDVANEKGWDLAPALFLLKRWPENDVTAAHLPVSWKDDPTPIPSGA